MPLFVFAASQVIAQKRGANLGHPSEEKERIQNSAYRPGSYLYFMKRPSAPLRISPAGSNPR